MTEKKWFAHGFDLAALGRSAPLTTSPRSTEHVEAFGIGYDWGKMAFGCDLPGALVASREYHRRADEELAWLELMA